MSTSPSYCQSCGAALTPGKRFCEQCGVAVINEPYAPPTGRQGQPPEPPARSSAFAPLPYTPPPPPPVSVETARPYITSLTPPAPKKRISTCLIVGLVLLFGGICLIVIAAGGFLIYRSTFSAFDRVQPQSTKSVPVEPQAPPTATPAPPTATPAPIATQPVVERTIQTYADNFSSPSTGWPQLDDDVRMLGYSEGGMYGIGLKQAGSYADVQIPHGIQLPLTETSIYFRARPVAGKGYFGALCDYTDENNAVMIAITEGAYLIARYINGENHYYLATPWVYDQYIKSENGDFQIQISCGNTIVLMVNGYSLPGVDNPNRKPGDIALFATSTQKAVLDGYFYYQVLFDDVELKAR